MPHYTTWGGTYVTRPVAIEDRDYSDNDYDINDFVIESTQADVLTGNIGTNSGPGGTSFLTENVGGTAGPGGTTYLTENLGSTSGPGGTSFLTGENGKVIVHPQYQPEADGLIRRGDTYQEKAQLMQHAPKESEYRPESQVNPVGVGYTEVEWTYFAEIVGGTATQLQESCANGTFVKGGQLGYTEVEWTYFADNLSGTAGPGGSTFTTGYAEAVGLDSSTVDVMNNLIGSAGPGCDDI